MRTYAVTITHEATLSNFVGEHVNGCNKAVVCITTGQRWVSIIDAANAEGVCNLTMSRWVNGKATPRNGKQYCLARELNKHLDTMLANKNYDELKAENERLKTELARTKKGAGEDHEKAALWDAHMAEIERAAALKESLQEAIAEARNTIEQRKRIAEKTAAAHNKAVSRVTEAEEELAKLESMTIEDWEGDEVKKFEHRRYNREYQRDKRNGNEN